MIPAQQPKRKEAKPFKENAHGYYIDTGVEGVFMPPEMLDFIDEHMGGVHNFVEKYNYFTEAQ